MKFQFLLVLYSYGIQRKGRSLSVFNFIYLSREINVKIQDYDSHNLGLKRRLHLT
jgi:hypothetical protein